MEIWKDVPGYDGLYRVSNLGRTKSMPKKIGARVKGETFLSVKKNPMGYPIIALCKNGKYKYKLVHRLVAELFIPNPHHHKIVNHIDGDPLNSSFDNLEWCTQSYNCDHWYYKLGKKYNLNKPIEQFDKVGNKIAEYRSLNEAAKKLGLNNGSIHANLTGKTHHAYGFVWRYAA